MWGVCFVNRGRYPYIIDKFIVNVTLTFVKIYVQLVKAYKIILIVE